MQAANERAMIPPAAQAADLRARRAPLSVPIANADRLVLPDALATTIKLAGPAPRRCPLARRRPATTSGQVTSIYGAGIVTCVKIRCTHPAL